MRSSRGASVNSMGPNVLRASWRAAMLTDDFGQSEDRGIGRIRM